MIEKSSVLFIFFNRLHESLLTFSKIREYQPTKLYLAADAGRNESEKEVCLKVRKAILDEIDWECEVHCNFSNINIGARYRIESAINWAFLKEEALIILEDDCLASSSFFTYCETLLLKYKDDKSVMMISGTNESLEINKDKDYYFSKLPHTWGWATWKRAWKLYDYELSIWKNNKKAYKKILIKQFEKDLRMYSKRMNEIEMLFKEVVDAWDYRWFLTFHFYEGLCISPPKNLISNIGFGPEATHTFDVNSKLSNLPVFLLDNTFTNSDRYIVNDYHIAYLDNRITKYNAFTYILRTILSHMSMESLVEELKENKIDSFFILGTQDLGKILASKLSSILNFKGFCGNDIGFGLYHEWLEKKSVEKINSCIVISSIEGEHEKEILSNMHFKMKIISWKSIVQSYISDSLIYEDFNEDKLRTFIEENMYYLIENDFI